MSQGKSGSLNVRPTRDDDLPALVMTSGNISEEPIAIDNDEAFERLGGIADYFLNHDREIYLRSDDSVLRVVSGAPRQIRRSVYFIISLVPVIII